MTRSKKKVHFVGIGGIGMSALARGFRAHGWQVTGSDLHSSELTRELAREHIKVFIGHARKNLPPNTGLLVYSQAISSKSAGYKEVSAAKKKRVPFLSYPEALGRLTAHYKTVAIAGAHGKSTTTALVGLILTHAKFSPTILVGTKVPQLGNSNFVSGKGSFFILEADEYKGAFLHYTPTYTLVTNIDREHLDYYKNFPHIKRTFLAFLDRTAQGGTLILNRDDPPLCSLNVPIKKIAKKRKLKVIWYSRNSSLAAKVKRVLKIPGSHNLSNALGALSLAYALGVKESVALTALGTYKGSWRRFEYKGLLRLKRRTFPVYDDYAHHPAEIKATLLSFREKYPHARIICVFQPHQAKRLKSLFRDFTRAFDAADSVIFLPLFGVTGRDAPSAYDSKRLAIQIKSKKESVLYLARPNYLKPTLRRLLSPVGKTFPAVIVMMGAGDIFQITPILLSSKNE